MNIILVSNSLAKRGALTLNHGQTILLGIAMLMLPLLLAAGLTYMALFHASLLPHPFLQSLVLSAQQNELDKNREYVQENLNAMAIKLGQMQAQMLRLDAMGDRLAKLSGIGRQEFNFTAKPGQGGAEPSIQKVLSPKEFSQQLDTLMSKLDERADQLGLMEAMLLQQKVKKVALPNQRPVQSGWYSSNFGWRIDPFTGKNAFHEGVDFMADVGSPIHAAGGGIVIFADVYAGYGRLIEIDHGNGLVSRYAHASKIFVKEGDVVLKGQKIAEVGSSGRSTGPHLHFEVRHQGAPQNPEHYLKANG
ncbi:MAG: M23 family metallopeptidase [Sulfuricella sp.]|nr:M23 family metallopeptidase [Sulfuricella sp.]